jgi:hypothetical protein
MIPFLEAESSLAIISLRDEDASSISFFWDAATNRFTLVRTELLTVLLRILRSSLCRCRFSAEEILVAKG